ncbi:hypothetical protein BaRGS_00012334 [Batillaria attramentaria]|uniref:AAA+ ATPase domain-containing protein n=1 Tax=Batillaria attramentaria TaxID=370345 RepID=A0ABD0LA74_9CAEN
MSRKQKSRKDEWNTCLKCDVLVHSRDVSNHEEMCQKGEALPHGYIKRKVLHATVICATDVKDLPKVPSSVKDDVVFVHPSTMLICGLCLGQPCVVNTSYVLHAWPSSVLHPASVALASNYHSSLPHSHQNIVTVEQFTWGMLRALQVEAELRTKHDAFLREEFLQYLSHKLDGRYIKKGTTHNVFYFGLRCTLYIKSVQPMPVHKREVVLMSPTPCHAHGDNQDLSQTFSELDISSVSDSGDAADTSSTVSVTDELTCSSVTDISVSEGQQMPATRLTFSRGILLYGPPGTGKTTLAQAVANEMSVFTVSISVTDVMSKFVGETERKLRALFQTASERCPSLIIIDNLDGLCPRRDDSSSDLEKRVVATFFTLLDGLSAKESSGVCLVLGITNKPHSIDPALRRPGRLDCDVETGVPSADERLQILQKLLRPVSHSISEATLKDISDARHGFVGADLALLVRKATEHAVKRSGAGCSPLLKADDLLQALDAVSPTAMKEVVLEVPQVRWADIGGQAEVKLKLRQAVEWQLKHPQVFTRFGISPPRGILMYGPPGCSKTMVAKALATESGLNFLAVKGPECFSKWVGESERAVREVFCKARAAAPSIVFFDEIDALAAERGSGGSNVADRVLTQLLTEMDGVERLNGVCVVAATNRPDKIDQALLRPGRFDQILYVPLPDADTRREILQIEFKRKPVAANVSLNELVNKTERYSGAELTAVCNEAALAALQEDIRSTEITSRHFHMALAAVKPGTSVERIKFYEDYNKRRQSGLRFV